MLELTILDPFFKLIGYLFIPLVGLYVIFSFVLLRQVQLMNNGFKTLWAPMFAFLGSAHFFVSLVLLLITILAAI